ncbi:amidohydrolase family protein [Chelatococcus sp. YT9]|nr:amidohydrolase family protein [Chelatococcus sp. YT9]
MLPADGIAASKASAAPSGTAPHPAESDQGILFRNVAIFDGRSHTLRMDLDLLVRGNAIAALVPKGTAVEASRVIDGRGCTLMPGLIDAHWHAMLANISELAALTADIGYIYLKAANEAEQTLLRGFTAVRDTGGPSFALKRAIDEGLVVGPRIFPSGAMISQTGGHGDFRMRAEVPRNATSGLSVAEKAGVTMIADGPDEVLRRVREQLMLGASQIKLVTGGGVTSLYDPIDGNQFTEAEIRAAVAAATDWGTYVCTHVYTAQGIQRAIDCGVKCIEHGQLADEDTVRRIADTGTWWSLQPFLKDEDANVHPDPRQGAEQEFIAQGTVRAYEWAKNYKAKVAWGTDILFSPGKTVTQGKQLAKLARWFTNAEVLSMATSTNAELLAMAGNRRPYQQPIGVIEPGAFADILLIAGNPLEDISLIADPARTMKLIMKDGKIFKDTLGEA